jgi:uncharacterized coiled-coil protein SlyX
MDAADELCRRIEELEAQAAFQEELHQRLDAVVARQDRELLDLKAQFRDLAGRIAELRDAGAAAADPADVVPPHY